MMSKTKYRVIFLFVMCLAALPTSLGVAHDPPHQPNRQITLKQQLEFGLRTRTPAEFAYIASLVNLVETDALPQRIVNMAFLWARRKSRYPIPYFARALTILSQREGFSVPPGPYTNSTFNP